MHMWTLRNAVELATPGSCSYAYESHMLHLWDGGVGGSKEIGAVYRFKQEHDAMDTVTNIAAGMLTAAPEHILSWPFLHEEWDEALVARIGGGLAAAAPGFRLDLQSSASAELQPRFREAFEVRRAACCTACCAACCLHGCVGRGPVHVRSPGLLRRRGVNGRLACAQAVEQSHEAWFEFDFLAGDIPPRMLEEWDAAQPGADLQLPPPNPFITANYDLLPGAPPNTVAAGAEATGSGGSVRLPDGAIAAPEQLMDAPGARLFHRVVTAFGTPRAVAMFKCDPRPDHRLLCLGENPAAECAPGRAQCVSCPSGQGSAAHTTVNGW